MAIKFIETEKDGQLGFWEITETTEQLLALLNPDTADLENFNRFRNERRKREWLATRLLLKQMTGCNSKIDYDPAGKPQLADLPGHISISHTSNCVVIYFHPTHQPGIDIELITRSVERSAGKFLSRDELNDCMKDNQLSNEDLLLRWCAKEAVFKMVPYSDIDFARQISCTAEQLSTKEGDFNATFTSSGISLQIPLHFRRIGDVLMVWGHLTL